MIEVINRELIVPREEYNIGTSYDNRSEVRLFHLRRVTPAESSYWTVFIGEPESLVERIITPLEENPATVAYGTGRQIIYDDWLWEVIRRIPSLMQDNTAASTAFATSFFILM